MDTLVVSTTKKSISIRVAANSLKKVIFNEAAPYCNQRLRECGYSGSIQHKEDITTEQPVVEPAAEVSNPNNPQEHRPTDQVDEIPAETPTDREDTPEI